MRILLLAPVHREKEFLKQKGNKPFVIGQGQQSWVDALEKLGYKVFVFRYTDSVIIPNRWRVYISDFFERRFPKWKGRYDKLRSLYYIFSLDNYIKNRRLLIFSERVLPQLIIISGGISSIFPQTIQKMKNNYRCKILLFSGVNPQISASPAEKKMVKRGIVDIVVENDGGYASFWKKLGAKKVIVLPISSVDPKLHRRMKLTKEEKDKYGCDICFVGSLTKERQEKLVNLSEFNIKVWGDILPNIGLIRKLRPFYYGEAYGEKMVKIFNGAKIVLNFQPKDMTYGGNMRTFEIPGCGAFQLADKVDVRWFSSNEEIVIFTNINDLRAKIRYYLDHEQERKDIAEKGFQRAYKQHRYDDRFKTLLSKI